MKRLTLFAPLILLLVLAACQATPAPTQDLSLIQTQAAQTVVANLTSNAPATETPPPPPPTDTPPPAPTATATPTATAAPIQGDPVLVLGAPDGVDDFNNDNNWTLFNSTCFSSEITDGYYVQTAKGVPNIVCWEVSWPLIQNYYIETMVEMPAACDTNDRFGVLFRAPDNLRGYLYGLTCGGQYTLTMWDGQQTTNFVNPTSNQAIKTNPGDMNRLGLMVYGGNYDMYVNGLYLGRVTDYTFTEPGKIGYYVRAATDQPFTVRYDNLALWLLEDELYPPGATLPPTTPIPVPPAGAPSGTASTYVNVRSGPSPYYPVLFVASPGATGEIIGVSADGSWWAVKIPTSIIGNGTGWVSKDYVSTTNTSGVPVIPAPPIPPSQKPPTPDPGEPTGIALQPVNIRSGPSTDYPSYGVAQQGAKGELVGKNADGTWWAVALSTSVAPDGYGWVSAQYVYAINAGDVPVLEAPPEIPVISVPAPPAGAPSAVNLEPVNVRSGPSSSYDTYGKLPIGTSMEVTGKSADGEWWVINVGTDVAADSQGWVLARVCQTTNTEDVPVVEAPPPS
jgi:uncharacterized protein YraI